jgi:hypothetical protein
LTIKRETVALDEDQRSDLASVQLLLAELSGSQVETIPFEDHRHARPALVALLVCTITSTS